MSWQKPARIGLAVAGLAVAGAIVYYSRKGPPPPAPPPDIAVLDPAMTSAGRSGEEIRSKDGKPNMRVIFATREEYTDGRLKFTKAVVEGLGDDKSKMRADVVETLGPAATGELPKQLKLTGHVVFEEQGGLSVECETATYDDPTGVVTIPGPVTFRRGRVSGNGVGATYDRKAGIVVIQDQASARVGPDAKGTGAAEATSKRMTMERGQHSLRLDENARIVSQSQTLTGAKATMLFTDDETALKFLQLEGAARVDPLPGASSNQPAMSADRIVIGFHPDGQTLQHATLTGQGVLTLRDEASTRSIKASWIDLFTGADGRTLTALKATDRVIVELPASATMPARTIRSNTLNATGDEKKGLTSARFEGNPQFEETPLKPAAGSSTVAKRTGTATALVLTLGGQLEAIEKAEFDQRARFESGAMTAEADKATYVEAKGMLELRPNTNEPRRRSSVNSGDFNVTSLTIDLVLNTENLIANGDVRSSLVRKPATGQKTSQGRLFSGSEPIRGRSAHLDYRKDTGTATYTGGVKAPAELQQADTLIRANRLVFEENTNRLSGTGEVDSRIPMSVTDENSKGQMKEQKVRADTMTYDDALRRADYKGKPVTLTTTDGDTEGLEMVFELAEDGKTLRRLHTKGQVFASRTDGYEFSGLELEYRVADELYILTGKADNLARVKEPPADAKAEMCNVMSGLRLEFSRKTGGVQNDNSGFKSFKIPCSESLRKPR